jgi:hypothetical protein
VVAGVAVTNPSVSRYLLGLLSLLVVFASVAVVALAVRRRLLPSWSGAQARLAEVVVGLLALVWILELLGAVGLFSLVPIVVASVIAAGVTVWGFGWDNIRRARPSPGSLGAAVLAVLIVAVVVAGWASPMLQSYDVGVVSFDSLWYHLPWAASFAQTAHITPLRFTDVQALTPFYPATGEMLHGLGIVLLARDTLSPAINVVFVALVLLAAWCIGSPRGLGALTTFGAALAMATPMMHFSQAGAAATDVIGVFFLLAAVAVFAAADESPAASALAALSAGLALSIKLSLAAPVLALTIGAIVGARRGERRPTALLWLICLLLAGGYWYVRNLIAVGNPLPWRSFGILPAPPQRLLEKTALSVSHYITDGHAWSHFFVPGLAAGLGRWWYLLIAAAVLGPVLCMLPGASRTVRILGAVALVSLAAYVVTPDSAAGLPGEPAGFVVNLRYAAPALALALAITPLAPALVGPRRQVALGLGFTALFVATVAKPSLWPDRHVAGAIALGGAVLIAGLAIVWVRARPRRVLAPARIAMLAVVLALGGAAAAGAYAWQRHYLRGRYAFRPRASTLAPVWAYFRTVHHARVGIVGTFGGFFSYPLWGVDLSNRVQYIAEHGPHGAFAPITSCSHWRAAVNAGHYRYLVTTPGRNPWRPRRLSPSPEGAWTVSDPAARRLLTIRAKGQRIYLFELTGPLQISGCPR